MEQKQPNNSTIQERQDLDKQALIEAIKEMPIIQIACKKAGVSRATYYRWRNEDNQFKRQSEDAMSQGIDFINDMSESQLITLIREKKMPAIALWLKTNHPRYGTKNQVVPQTEPMENLNPEDPRYSEYQKLKLVAEQYENELRKTIVANIHADTP